MFSYNDTCLFEQSQGPGYLSLCSLVAGSNTLEALDLSELFMDLVAQRRGDFTLFAWTFHFHNNYTLTVWSVGKPKQFSTFVVVSLWYFKGQGPTHTPSPL